jgi:uncharacterized protein YhbP (UPF0306 family)
MSGHEAKGDLHSRIATFLAAHHVMSLATAGPDGPHAANLFYACDGFSLIWISDPNSRHSREVEAHGCAATTIAPDYADFSAIRGLQLWGFAYRVSSTERAGHMAILEARYPFLGRPAEGPEAMHDAYARAGVYRLDPKRIVLIDNTKGFGHKETLDLS